MLIVIDADGFVRGLAADVTQATLPGEQIIDVIGYDPSDRGQRAVKARGKWRVEPVVMPPPPLDQLKAQAKGRVIATADQITARITGQYPAAEVASWPTQEAESRAIVAGADAAAAPLISALATAAKISLKDYAAGVLVKAANYRVIVAAVKALRDQTEAAVNAAASQQEIEDALTAAKAAADAKAAELGLA